MKIEVRHIVLLAICVLLVIAAAGTALAQPPKCANQITACGCTIGAPGNYTVENDLSYSQGLTLKNACIDIEGQDITLTVNYPIYGPVSAYVDCGNPIPPGPAARAALAPSSAKNSGIGIHVLPSASKVSMILNYGYGDYGYTVCGWNYGVESEGSNVTWNGLVADYNNVGALFNNSTASSCIDCYFDYNTTGLEIAGGSGNTIAGVEAYYNSQYGFWLNGTNNDSFSVTYGAGNKLAGYYLGCSSTANTKPPIPCTTNLTTGINLQTSEAYENGKYGFAVEQGSIHNQIIENEAAENGKFDFIDGNANCIYNQYSDNEYLTKSPKCIQ